jgi:hypothetical protein
MELRHQATQKIIVVVIYRQILIPGVPGDKIFSKLEGVIQGKENIGVSVHFGDKSVPRNNMTESIKCRRYGIIPVTMKFSRF